MALTFANIADDDVIQKDDGKDMLGHTKFAPGKPLTLLLNHADYCVDTHEINHSYNKRPIKWLKANAMLKTKCKQYAVKVAKN